MQYFYSKKYLYFVLFAGIAGSLGIVVAKAAGYRFSVGECIFYLALAFALTYYGLNAYTYKLTLTDAQIIITGLRKNIYQLSDIKGMWIHIAQPNIPVLVIDFKSGQRLLIWSLLKDFNSLIREIASHVKNIPIINTTTYRY